MPESRFNLKNKKAKSKSLIILVFNYDNLRVKVSSGISVPPKYWSDSKQKIKETIEFLEHSSLNQKLKGMNVLICSIYESFKLEGLIPDPEILKKKFIESLKNPNKKVIPKKFWEYFDEFVKYKRKFSEDVRDYDKSLRKHLLKIEQKMRKNLTFEGLKKKTGGIIEEMDYYLTFEAINSKGESGLTTNTVGKQFKNLKVFLNWSFDEGYYAPFSLKHIITKTEDVDNIYLTEAELKLVEKIKLDNDQEKIVRDLFLIGCETALRFSDFSTLTKESIMKNEIHFRPHKTLGQSKNNKVIIPISSRLKRILAKYNNVPPILENGNVTEFNKIIRIICEKAEINTEIVIYRKIAGKQIKEIRKKFLEVSSHTCRRTFCTLKFLDNMPAQVVMKFSGHTTERNFLRYLKLDAELVAKKYSHFFK